MASLIHSELLVTWIAIIAAIAARPLTPDTSEARFLGNWLEQRGINSWFKANLQSLKQQVWAPKSTESAATMLTEIFLPLALDTMKENWPKFALPNKINSKPFNFTSASIADLLNKDWLSQILSNNELSREIVATMREAKEPSLPFHLIDTLTELYGSQTSCVQLLLCEWAPTVWSMQKRLDFQLGESQSAQVPKEEDKENITEATTLAPALLQPRKRRQTEAEMESEAQPNDLYQVYTQQCQKLFPDCHLLL